MDSLFSALQVEKRPQDSGFMLLKHSKYCCFRDISFFGRICVFLRFGVALGVILGDFGDRWGELCDFLEVKTTIDFVSLF